MRFHIASVLALATTVLAQWEATDGFNVFKTPAVDEKVPAGKPYSVEWTYNSKFPGSISVELFGGNSPSTLQSLGVLATGVAATSEAYTWAVDATLGSHPRYGIKLILESDPLIFQWSNSFTIGASNVTISSSTSVSPTSSVPASTSSAPVTSTKTTITSSSSKSLVTSVTKTTSSVSSSITHSNSTTSSVEGSSTSTSASATFTPTPSSTPSAVPTGGANAAAAGSFAALLGGVAVAVLAF
ncbi:Ser-Thr-rich glycosyl-phosphatidyl-inositol-anchored membrane family-domain-containing protein [Podospora fimiseda]|uniref:Ser-Thr-rich glycosyl-phosphatidyl-inositol-anchored membrane family-domain-containing protein n=1 Tax=Podospora fimiseda TaxID=252190 RepID=A0AAN7BTG7_9PEZI|nr:Ser-Thr-rich glycosyl-phosphatidyl-inositol-anchored membrane family-domain-containing protein [Podospora fimiseda]